MIKVKDANKNAWKDVAYMVSDVLSDYEDPLHNPSLKGKDREKVYRAYENVLAFANKKIGQYSK